MTVLRREETPSTGANPATLLDLSHSYSAHPPFVPELIHLRRSHRVMN